MTDDAHRPLTEQERALGHAATRQGGICGACGRALAADEPIWRVSRVAWLRTGGERVWWVVPVGAECVSAEVRRESDQREPEGCGGCGRPVYQQPSKQRRIQPFCCTRCRKVAQRVGVQRGEEAAS